MNITEVRLVDDHGVTHIFNGHGEARLVRTHMDDALTPEKSTQVRYLSVHLNLEAQQ
jgi:hypothetical protein